MRILADTSVWIDHLRRGNDSLAALLRAGQVLAHPFVVGEIACGRVRNRAEILWRLEALPAVPVARHAEALALIDERDLAGLGLGWVDVHLLASALIADHPLWTFDKTLQSAAASLDVSAAHT